jgi:hypothetical protein
MFAWYLGAAECYAYLPDYDGSDDDYELINMARCRWFSREWCPQELIAPKLLYFYDVTWTLRGDKISLSWHLSRIAKIDKRTLLDPDRLSTIPVRDA